MNCKAGGYNNAFSHIYVETRIMHHARTQEILSRFPNAQIIEVTHYKDVFNRRRQQYEAQHRSQSLILAMKEGHFFYEGAKPCQDFGNDNFYYCSTMMNCIYNCSYCYLKGMYPSGNLVVFVNLEDYFAKLDAILEQQSMYVCVSYDADLLALESWMGYASEWAKYARKHPNLKLEIRTKSARKEMWEELPVLQNVVYAFTVSPQKIIEESEKNTPSVQARVDCAMQGIRRGFPVRFCFDPILYLPEWEKWYLQLFMQMDTTFVREGCTWEQLDAVSVGGFRISKEYMKKIRRVEKNSPIVQFPYMNVEGVYQYPPELLAKMENLICEELRQRMPPERIFREVNDQ